ncbi:MAG: LysE family translocator [Rhodospirillaceae bacterium]
MTSMLSFALLWIVAVVTPGPNVLLIGSSAVALRRRESLLTVAGILCGTVVWGCAGFFGVGLLFRAAPWIYIGLKLAGGGYIVYLGARLILKGGEHPAALPAAARGAGRRAFRRGLMTQLSNPKSGAFVATIFAATMPQDAPLSAGIAAVCTMVAISGSWYGLLAWGLGLARVKAAYLKARRGIERASGALFVFFGLEIALRK